jgi:mannose-1-phosphate guanylyltransferase
MMSERPTASLVMPTRAMLLAAGEGTRLRPFTETVPKCMLPVAGKPVLEHNIEWLRKFGVTNLVINLHYLPEAVTNHFGDGNGWGVRINYSTEPELLGTAGAVRNAAHFFDDAFFVWYADNLSTCRLDRLWELHRARGGIATMALHHRDDPTKSGIVGLDETDRIVRFLEKPEREQVFSHWVNAGILLLEPEAIDSIPTRGASDFGRDVFPALLDAGATLIGYRMASDEGLWWIDTAADFKRVQSTLSEQLKGETAAQD